MGRHTSKKAMPTPTAQRALIRWRGPARSGFTVEAPMETSLSTTGPAAIPSYGLRSQEMFLHLRLNGTFFLFAPIGLVDRRLDRRPVLGRKGPARGPNQGRYSRSRAPRSVSRSVAEYS